MNINSTNPNLSPFDRGVEAWYAEEPLDYNELTGEINPYVKGTPEYYEYERGYLNEVFKG